MVEPETASTIAGAANQQESLVGKIVSHRGTHVGIISLLITGLVTLQAEVSSVKSAMDLVPVFQKEVQEIKARLDDHEGIAKGFEEHKEEQVIHATDNARRLLMIESLEPLKKDIERLKRDIESLRLLIEKSTPE